MQELSHFETLKDFEPSISSIFQGAKKGAFDQNQVLPMASGDGPRWYQGISMKKFRIHDFQF